MKYKSFFWAVLSILLYAECTCNTTYNIAEESTSNATDSLISMSKQDEPKQYDAFTLEINLLKEQLELIQKKIQLIEKLRDHYQNSNEQIPLVSADALDKNSHIYESDYGSHSYINQHCNVCPSTRNISIEESFPERNYENILNKIFKRFTVEFTKSVRDVQFLPTKMLQRTPDEVSTSTVIVFLVGDNEFAVYNLNGNSILNFTAGHAVKQFAVNVFTDATLGTDNTIRVHNININRVRYENPEESQQTKKSVKFKFVLEYNATLEYIYDLEKNQIIREDEQIKALSSRRDKGYYSISAILGKNNKFLAFGDGEGALNILHRNGTFRGKFVFLDARFKTIQKFYPNPLYATDKGVGFFNPNAMGIINPLCDPPGEPILKIEIDQYSTNHFFALLQSGDILFYELKQTGGICKVEAKRSISQSANIDPRNFDIYSSKSFILMQNNKKSTNIVAHNITDVKFASIADLEYYDISFHSAKVDEKEVSKANYVTSKTSFSSSFIGAYVQFNNGSSSFTLSELKIFEKPSTDWLSNVRIPIVFIAVFLALGYQFWSKRKKREDEDVMETLSRFNLHEGSKGGKVKFGGRDLSGLKESLDSLTKQTSQMQDDLGGMTSKILSKGLNKHDYADDDYQEISGVGYLYSTLYEYF